MGLKCERYKCQDKSTTRQDSVYKTGVKSQGQSEEKESEMSQGPCVDEKKTRQDKTRQETRSEVKRPLASLTTLESKVRGKNKGADAEAMTDKSIMEKEMAGNPTPVPLSFRVVTF